MIRVAMWSGPRNMSTTMMRSFGARADTACVDEPFYAAFLKLTGLDHPMRDAIFAAHESDPEQVAKAMIDPPPGEQRIFYQKQMTHHMVDGIPRDWMKVCRHVFLIRHPARVLASYARKMTIASLEAIGFPQQAELFDFAGQLMGQTPVVIDSDDILRDPEGMMRALCDALGLPWDAGMLTWPAGARAEDGAWASHWYDAVWRSTGFGPPPGPLPELQGELMDICAAALPIYERLAAHKLAAKAV